jgi:Trp operon repressor
VPANSSTSPSEEYRQRQQAREEKVARFDKLHLRFGNVRLLLVIATLVAAWWCLEGDAFSPWWLLLPVFLFVALAIFHARVLRQRVCAERAVDVYRKGLARIEDRWVGIGHKGERIDISSSLYATDLDLFGHGSLFELLSQARTRMGEDVLAHWLLSPSSLTEIGERHAAVTELRDRLDLREDMQILGEDLKVGVHPEALTKWAEAPNQFTRQGMRWVALLLSVVAIAAAILWGEWGIKAPFFAVVLVEGVIVAAFRRRTQEILHSAEDALKDIKLLALLLTRLERESFLAPRLRVIQGALSSHHRSASQAIGRLDVMVQHVRSLDHPIMRLFDIPLLYSVQVAYAAEAWRRNHGLAVRSWLNVLGEIEGLLSIAAYSYEHPADPFPEFVEGDPIFEAEALGHPLIAAAKCIRNSVNIGGETRALLISGSNMSGVGINTVLAMAGAPVRAQRLRLTPLHIGASILVSDSLLEGSSRFYAEITRLRQICELAEKNPPALFLLDELLQGTNSHDRLIGAQGVVRALVESGAIGLISTHDLALTNIGVPAGGHLHNVHLQDEIADGRMSFDFKLREGVVTKSNGIELMRLIGLNV